MKIIKYFFVLYSLLFTVSANAQNWSYVYIQGDKETPFYVKLEGEMLPRYSKNYYIIPQLSAGPIDLQILFQQNEYPAQNFKVLVPENSHRGFLLTKKDGNFALYDIQQKFYMMPGDAGEDRLPEIVPVKTKSNIPPVTAATDEKTMLDQAFKKTTDNDPQFINNVVLENNQSVQKQPETTATIIEESGTQPEVKEETDVINAETTSTQQPVTTEQQPVLDEETPVENSTTNIVQEEPVIETTNTVSETISEQAVQEAPAVVSTNTIPQPVETPSAPVFVPSEPATTRESKPRQKVNPDCPEPLNDVAFDKIYNSTKNREDDKSRISYLMDIAKENCYSTQQVYFLTREIQAESMRYSFLKKVYSKVTDQYNFRQLEDHLFKTLEWKSYFRLIND